MSVTATYDKAAGTNYSLHNLAARGLKFVEGTLTFAGTGGAAQTLKFPLGTVKGCYIEPSNGFVFKYDRTNTKVLIYHVASATTATMYLVSTCTGLALASITSVAFLAWGY